MSLNLRYIKSRAAVLTVFAALFLAAAGLALSLALTIPAFVPPALAISGDITGDSVNVRSGPGTDSGVIASLNSNDTVAIVGNSNGWYQVQTGSLTGWVIGDYCKVVPTSLTVIESTVNVRKGPGTDYDSYGQISQGTVLTLLDLSGDWFKVQAASGTIGYVRADLVSEGSSTAVTPPVSKPANPDNAAPATTPATTAPVVPRVVLDGRQVSFSIDPAFESGRLLVPLRTIFEAMGATVTWNQDTQTAGAVRGGVTVIIPLNSTTPSVNGQAWTLDVPAKVVNNVTLAPVRFVAEAFGGKVAWDGSTYIAYITSPDGNAVVTVPDSGNSANPNGDPASNPADNSDNASNDSNSANTGAPTTGQVVVTLDSTSSGVAVTMTGDGYMQVVVKENSGQLIYTIKNKSLPGAFSLSQPLGSGTVTVTGTNTSTGASVEIKFPAGQAYNLQTEADGAIETVSFGL